jgi:hypothetical protein
MFLTSDQSLVRGDDARSWQLCDMFMMSISPSYAGPSQPIVMGMLIKNGKQNKVRRTALHSVAIWAKHLCQHLAALRSVHCSIQRPPLQLQHGRMEYAWVARHKDPLVCGVGAIFLHLLCRFHCSGEAPPQI